MQKFMEGANHFTERYLFNQAMATYYKEINIYSKLKLLFRVLNIDLADSEFMEKAYRFVIESCEKLKWVYVFTYFNVHRYLSRI